MTRRFAQVMPPRPLAAPAGADGAIISFVPGVSAGPTGDGSFCTLVWDDGTRQAVYERTRFGRNPAYEAGVRVVAVRDETLSLSKTHFEIGRDDEGVVYVVDRHSTNGVRIVRDGEAADAPVGARVPLRAGDVLELGDRSVRVEVCA